ncbi:hypothetical protein [Actinomadura decatromicini]|uniref:Uncharacterized protein n=1 Tax=Actinomadura decatromicini TaxID=2604572 RepID=A0A5D3FB04_9ACTN|nr:hypothetical protein [Actinomadura decatromicini]TYK45084.1 hypothetical protein FXF68_30855 [Actinomadura decatromicini]
MAAAALAIVSAAGFGAVHLTGLAGKAGSDGTGRRGPAPAASSPTGTPGGRGPEPGSEGPGAPTGSATAKSGGPPGKPGHTPGGGRGGPSPTPSATGAPPPPEIDLGWGGPSLGNANPDAGGCKLFWVSQRGRRATILSIGSTTQFQPSGTESGDGLPVNSLTPGPACLRPRADGSLPSWSFDADGDGVPEKHSASGPCEPGAVVSAERWCGVIVKPDLPSRPGRYSGRVTWRLSTDCESRAEDPCSRLSGRNRPSAERPVKVRWTMVCLVSFGVSRSDDGTYYLSGYRLSC